MTKILLILSGLNKGGTEYFVYNYLQELVKTNLFIFDIYSYSNNDLSMISKFKKLGCQIYTGCAPSLRKYYKSRKDFINFLKDKHYDTIHCHCNYDNAMFLKIAYKNHIRSRISHYHDTITYSTKNIFKKIRTNIKKRICIKYSTINLGCSKEALQSHDIKNRCIVIKNIIDYKKFANYKTKKDSIDICFKDKTILGNISICSKKKNQEFCIELFKEYRKINNDSILILGGPGDFSSIKEKCIKYEIYDSVIFIGPRDDVEKWLQIFDFYIMPSLYEGFGIIAVEAQYAGAYVLASTNVPKTTDYGCISYLDLNNIKNWLEILINKPKSKLIEYNVKDDVNLLIKIYENRI